MRKSSHVDLGTIANVATALTVITGVGFGLVEAQRSRRARQERAAYAAVQALLSPEWMRSMIVVHNIPDNSTAGSIESDASVLDAVHSVGITLEGIGYSVYARIVPLRVVADLVGGTVRLAWRKLQPYIEEERRRSGSQRLLSGSNGSLCNWNDIRRARRTWRQERTRLIAIGNRRRVTDRQRGAAENSGERRLLACSCRAASACAPQNCSIHHLPFPGKSQNIPGGF